MVSETTPPTPTVPPAVAEFLVEHRAMRGDNPHPASIRAFVRECVDPMASASWNVNDDLLVRATYTLLGMERADVSGLLALAVRAHRSRRLELIESTRSAS